MAFRRLSLAALLLLCGSVMAQNYQIPNGDFEQWDGTQNTSEPKHWNSFATSDGTFASMASSPHHYRRNGGRPGSTGSSYLTIYTKSILGIKANGNMTTGRIHAGSMSATSSSNYNYTQRADSNFCMPITATPDSLYMWVSFYAKEASSEASIKATLHGDSDYKDPNDNTTASLYTARAEVEFGRTTSSSTAMEWTLLKVPFDYSGTADPAYMLISMTTNKTPGEGSANDSLSIDDMVLVYSAWLTDLQMGGTTVEGFQKDVFEYDITCDDTAYAQLAATLSYTTEVEDAQVEVENITVDSTFCQLVVTVTAEDGITQKVYTLNVHLNITEENNDDPDDPDDPVGIDVAETANLALFPNPTTGLVNIASAVPVEAVEVYDLQGRRVASKQYFDGSVAVDLSGLEQGSYILRVKTNEGWKVQTVVLTK